MVALNSWRSLGKMETRIPREPKKRHAGRWRWTFNCNGMIWHTSVVPSFALQISPVPNPPPPLNPPLTQRVRLPGAPSIQMNVPAIYHNALPPPLAQEP